MKKLLLFMLLLTAVAATAHAQEKRTKKIGAGLDYIMPAGVFAETYKSGFGASANFQYAVGDNVNFTFHAGFISASGSGIVYAGKGSTAEFRTLFIPLKAGFKFQIVKYLYGGIDLGYTRAGKTTGDVNQVNIDYGVKDNMFLYSGGISAELPISEKSDFELGLRYESWANRTNRAFFGLRGAFNFTL